MAADAPAVRQTRRRDTGDEQKIEMSAGIMGMSTTGNDDLSLTASYIVRVVRRLT